MKERIIAIDGPAGSGKSTAARHLDEALGFTYINTGAMYRAVALLAVEGGFDLTDEKRIAEIAADMRFEYAQTNGPPSPRSGAAGRQRFIVNGKDRTEELFTAALTEKLKPVVNNVAVRAALVEKMRTAARAIIAAGAKGAVLEGRDIGTVVFPDAAVKFYMSADLAARAERRAAELKTRNEMVDLPGLQRQIQARDDADKAREVGALIHAPDAIDVDTTHFTEEQTLQRLLAVVREKGDLGF
jgi:cytidylate kinase